MFLVNRDPLSLGNQYRRVTQDLDDLLVPAMYLLHHLNQPRTVAPKQPEGADKDNFVVKVDVQQFLPEEVSVKMVDNFVVVEGKHEERQDEQGTYVSRQFVRRYEIPSDVNKDNITCSLSSDGVLCLHAPRVTPEQKQNERTLSINFTGKPALSNEGGKSTGNEGQKAKEGGAA